MEDIVETKCQIQETLDNYNGGPLIGIEYIVELVRILYFLKCDNCWLESGTISFALNSVILSLLEKKNK